MRFNFGSKLVSFSLSVVYKGSNFMVFTKSADLIPACGDIDSCAHAPPLFMLSIAVIECF